MALNLTPEYFEADRRYRAASTNADRLAALEEMLRIIPKHKASEKKQSDLKKRISEMRHAVEHAPKKGAPPDPYHLEPQGAGQVLLIGMPNSGKSSIVGALTKAPVKITEFPYGTAMPTPGMGLHEDVPIELVDLPPVTPEHMPPGLVNAIRNTHAVLLVADLTAPSVLEDIEALLAMLEERGIGGTEPDAEDDSPQIGPGLLIACTKADAPGAADTLAVLREMRPARPEMVAVSSTTGEGLTEMMAKLFAMFGVIRVYSKQPGKPADREKPFTLPVGSTVGELALRIHKDLAEQLKFARVWGTHGHAGQQVHATHVLYDRDVVELHD